MATLCSFATVRDKPLETSLIFCFVDKLQYYRGRVKAEAVVVVTFVSEQLSVTVVTLRSATYAIDAASGKESFSSLQDEELESQFLRFRSFNSFRSLRSLAFLHSRCLKDLQPAASALTPSLVLLLPICALTLSELH